MFECIKFILSSVVDFIAMLFTIDVGNGFSLGLVMCVVFIFLPTCLVLFNFLKNAYDIELLEIFNDYKKEKKKQEKSKTKKGD